MTSIGTLAVHVTNLEHQVVVLAADLLKTDMARAEIAFYTFTTADARRKFVWRLLSTFVADRGLLDRFGEFLRRFGAVATTRNKFAHSTYELMRQPYRMGTIKFAPDFDAAPRAGRRGKPFSVADELRRTTAECRVLERELAQLIKRARPIIADRPVAPLQVWKPISA